MTENLGIEIEYKNSDGKFATFQKKLKGKTLAIVCDYNTKKFADAFVQNNAIENYEIIYFDNENLVPDETVYPVVIEKTKTVDFILAVGSGSLNDVVKYAATVNQKQCGVLATAPSMDGYLSKGSALMEKEMKVTETVNPPSVCLVDLDVLANAPREMIAAGFGDIVGKITCLTDWKLSHILNGEPIHEESYALMEKARNECIANVDKIAKFDKGAIKSLIDALLTAGLSMAICGNSRPASGSEHHISHYLEMDFVKRKEVIPAHGIKVAIGTLVSIELYRYLSSHKIKFDKCEEVYRLVESLPNVDDVRALLVKVGCPTRFSLLGVRKETMLDTIRYAYTVRERFTVLTLIHQLGLTDEITPIIMDKYF